MVGGTQAISEKPKVAHLVPMLSLDKTYLSDDILKWSEGEKVLGLLKIDGSSLHLHYSKGRLVKALTRGDGRYGEDVSDRAHWVSDVPLRISVHEDFSVRGELYCPQSSFFELMSTMEGLGLEKPSSTRNIVAGLLGRKAYLYLLRYTRFFCFDIVDPKNTLSLRTELAKIEFLKDLGFSVPPYQICQSLAEINDFLTLGQQHMENSDYLIDGIVWVLNDLKKHSELGATAHHPRYKLAFKWAGATAVTRLKSIYWSTSRLGIVTPVAQIDPVELSGATISNVSLHNAQFVRSFALSAGDDIEVVRSGEVIPKFLRVVQKGNESPEFPEFCPSCQSPLHDDGVRLRCLNGAACPAQLSGQIVNWIRAVEIMDLSDKRLNQMIEAGLVQQPGDLYRLSKDQLLTLPQVKTKMADKLIERIGRTRKLPLAVFLNGLGIAGMGQNSWEKLTGSFGRAVDLEFILNLKPEDIIPIPGFAERTAVQIVSGLQVARPLIADLLEVGVLPEKMEGGTSDDLPLKDQSFVITGTLGRPRSEYEQAIKSKGGKLSGSVSSKTTALIIEDLNSTSNKAKTARELGVPLWSEAELQDLLGLL